MDADRLTLIAELLTDVERIDLLRAIDDWQMSREIPDDLDGLRRALLRAEGIECLEAGDESDEKAA